MSLNPLDEIISPERNNLSKFPQKIPLRTFCIKLTPKISPNPLDEIISPERNNLSKFPKKIRYVLFVSN